MSVTPSDDSDFPDTLQLLRHVNKLLAQQADVDLWDLTDDQLLQVTELRHRIRQRLVALGLPLVQEINDRGLAKDEGGTAEFLQARLNISATEAKARVRVAAAVAGPLAATGKALRDGDLSFDHARVIVSITERVHRDVDPDVRARVESFLINAATDVDPVELEKIGRALLVKINPRRGGNGGGARRAKG
jgi:uncharacterized protein DUF222